MAGLARGIASAEDGAELSEASRHDPGRLDPRRLDPGHLHPSDLHPSHGDADASLTTLSYRSRAMDVPGEAAMQRLLFHARARNRSLGVTGMLHFTGGRYYQWLEGPHKGVAEVWHSIRCDARHAEIELLGEQQAPARLFAGWDMQWFRHADAAAGGAPGIADQRAWTQDAVALAQFALDGNRASVAGLLAGRLAPGSPVRSLFGSLIEPAVRLLGDWWREDRCRDFDVTLALALLQGVIRQIVTPDPVPFQAKACRILVTPQPGEDHILGSALVGGCFWDAGWNVSVEFPKSDAELSGLAENAWFDAINLSLSDVYSREEWLPRMAETIRTVRRASRNPDLVIGVGGRAFLHHAKVAAVTVGADIACSSSLEAVDEISYAMYRRATFSMRRSRALTSLVGSPPVITLAATVSPGWKIVH